MQSFLVIKIEGNWILEMAITEGAKGRTVIHSLSSGKSVKYPLILGDY